MVLFERNGLGRDMDKALQSVHWSVKDCVRTFNNVNADMFECLFGVRQGCVLGLFCVFSFS